MSRRCSTPCTSIGVTSRCNGRIQVARDNRRSRRAGRDRFQVGNSIVSAGALAGPPTNSAGASMSRCRSSTVRAPASAPSSMVVWTRFSSSIRSSTRSSELRSSSSIVVRASTVRPAANSEITDCTGCSSGGLGRRVASLGTRATAVTRGASASVCPRCAGVRRLARRPHPEVSDGPPAVRWPDG